MGLKAPKILDFKCYQFSKCLGLTIDHDEYGRIHGVRGPDLKWVWKGRRGQCIKDRKKLDEAFDLALEDLYSMVEYLPRCEGCDSYLHDDVCLDCDREESLSDAR